eukprot:m.61897 g.61897  ORF g.61897 m.61897 type:complete len:164 (+) comp11460_c0_seq2:58-549(+)
MADILTCVIGKDGPDFCTSINEHGEKYNYVGDVRNRKAHGWGRRKYADGSECFGLFHEGKVLFPFVLHSDSLKYMLFLESDFEFFAYESSNERHVEVMEMASKSIDRALELTSLPWSPITHYYDKFRPADDFIISVLICSIRLRSKGCEVPTEMWEMILSFVF